MAIALNYRYSVVLKHLYPDLETGKHYILRDKSDGNGPQLQWITKAVAKPTTKELTDAKEAAINAWWWARLRTKRDTKLKKSDWTQGADTPSSIKNAWATYRQKLRDLPTTVSKPSFATLDDQRDYTMHDNMMALFPAEPS